MLYRLQFEDQVVRIDLTEHRLEQRHGGCAEFATELFGLPRGRVSQAEGRARAKDLRDKGAREWGMEG